MRKVVAIRTLIMAALVTCCALALWAGGRDVAVYSLGYWFGALLSYGLFRESKSGDLTVTVGVDDQVSEKLDSLAERCAELEHRVRGART